MMHDQIYSLLNAEGAGGAGSCGERILLGQQHAVAHEILTLERRRNELITDHRDTLNRMDDTIRQLAEIAGGLAADLAAIQAFHKR